MSIETAASVRLQMKKKAAETKMTRKPGSSRGSSRKERWKSVIAQVSFRKLLKTES
jgi:hypothetical protein